MILRTALIALFALKLLLSFLIDSPIPSLSFANLFVDFLIITVAMASVFSGFVVGRIARSISPLLVIWLAFLLYLVAVSFFLETYQGVEYYARFLIPVLFYMGLMAGRPTLPVAIENVALFVVVLLVLLSVAGLFFMPININRFEEKLPTYFSGLHKSAYILAINAALVFYLYSSGTLKKLYFLTIFASSTYFVFFGWDVRTASVFTLAFLLFLAVSRASVPVRLLVTLASIPIFLSLTMFDFRFDLNAFSSGRLGMWVYKIGYFYDASIWQKIFGRGFGADYVEISGWVDEKDSHNNFLQITTEYGLAGLALLVGTTITLYKGLKAKYSKALVVGLVVTGVLSNGIYFRPLPCLYFFFALYVFEAKWRKQEDNQNGIS